MNTYFKSRQPSNPVVYVEDENGWRSYVPGGIIQKNIGALPNYLRQHADEVPFDDVIDLVRACEAQADLKARERALEPEAPWGIGGWLVLPIIGLCITALWSLVDIARYLPDMWGAWDVLTNSASDAYHPLWGPYIGFSSFAQFFLVLAPLFILWLISKKKRVLPTVIICFYALLLFFMLIDFVAVVTFISQLLAERGAASDISGQVMQSAQNVWKGMVFCGIWIPYFLFSKRIRATFTQPWSERGRRMEADSRRSVIATLAAEKRALREQEPAAITQATEGGEVAAVEAAAIVQVAATDLVQPAPEVDSVQTPSTEPSPAYWQQPQPVPSYWPPAPAPAAKPRKIVLIPVLAVLVIVLGVVTVLAAWRDMNPPLVKNPVTISTDVNGNSAKHYSNGDFSYSFDYPSDWVLQEDPTSDATAHSSLVFDPQGELIDRLSLDSATIAGFTYATSGRSLTDVLADLRDGFTQGIAQGGLTIDEPFAETTVGGLPAIKAACSTIETDGTKIIAYVYYAVGQDLVYYIELDYTGRPTDNSKARLDAILASFRPTP